MLQRHKISVAASIVLAVAITGSLAGCDSGGGSGSDPNNPHQVEVMTPWTDGAEQLGYRAVGKLLSTTYPDIELIDSSVSGAGGANARAAVQARLDAKNPPDSFLARAGAEIEGYAGAHALQDLTAFYATSGLDKVVPASLTNTMRVNGRIYGIPVNVHRANLVWANTASLQASGVDTSIPPISIDEWLGDLELLRKSGVEHPLAIGEGWTQVVLFESVLIAGLGPDDYMGLFTGDVPWDDPRVSTAIAQYGQLLDYAERDFDGKDWTEAANLVATGKAAYVVLPDSADGRFRQDGLTYDKEYLGFATPGTDGTFDFFADSFTLPVGAPHDTGAKDWLTVVASVEGQTAFSVAAGSIPARNDIDPTKFSEYQQRAITAFAVSRVVPSLAQGAATSPAWLTDITEAIRDFGHVRKPAALQKALVQAAADGLK